jgi:hypothetical protein
MCSTEISQAEVLLEQEKLTTKIDFSKMSYVGLNWFELEENRLKDGI